MIYLYCLGVIIVGAVLFVAMDNLTGYIFGGALIGHGMVLAAMSVGKDSARNR